MPVLLHAVSLSSGLDQIGAYAGLAAIVGLGVLSALYISQAREVKRLRDWAGRSPERDAEEQARVAGQAATAPATTATAATTAAARPRAAAPAAPAGATPTPPPRPPVPG
ncbi:MAG: hypothetical protein KGR19_03800, partial [Acidobacteria bacterium]|nr:hypothetical protein [Acidobacteriota bacterium]